MVLLGQPPGNKPSFLPNHKVMVVTVYEQDTLNSVRQEKIRRGEIGREANGAVVEFVR